MSKLEDGYIYGDSNGNVRFVSYDSLGGGGVFFALIILATLFLEKFGNFLINSQWIVLIPTLIAVVIRYFLFDKDSSKKQKIFNIVSDAVRTLGIYGVLIALFAKVLSCHILDRIYVALGLGLLFAAAYAFINTVCKFFRRRQWYVAHLVASFITALASLLIYKTQVNNGNLKLPDFSSGITPTQPNSLDTLIDAVDKMHPSAASSAGPSMSIFLVGFVFAALIVGLLVFVGVTIGKKINRETQAKFDAIGSELKRLLPNDADEYYVNCDGISYVDKEDDRHFITFKQLGYESFPVEKESITMHYIINMGRWLLKNIVSDATRYRVEVSREGLGHYRLRTHESIRRNTLKHW